MYTEFGYQDFLSAHPVRQMYHTTDFYVEQRSILKCAETKKVPLSRQIIQLSIFCLSVTLKYKQNAAIYASSFKITQELFSFR